MAIIRLVFVCLLWLCGVISAHADVSISGADEQVRSNIFAYLRLDDEPCDAPDWRVRRLFADADTEIRESLEVVGYYNVEIEKNSIPAPPAGRQTLSLRLDSRFYCASYPLKSRQVVRRISSWTTR